MDEDERLKARVELGERYGVAWHDERIPEAMARFGIGPYSRTIEPTLVRPSVLIHPTS